jgi:hypothetical protein
MTKYQAPLAARPAAVDSANARGQRDQVQRQTVGSPLVDGKPLMKPGWATRSSTRTAGQNRRTYAARRSKFGWLDGCISAPRNR